jgi:hypothetical protein
MLRAIGLSKGSAPNLARANPAFWVGQLNSATALSGTALRAPLRRHTNWWQRRVGGDLCEGAKNELHWLRC